MACRVRAGGEYGSRSAVRGAAAYFAFSFEVRRMPPWARERVSLHSSTSLRTISPQCTARSRGRVAVDERHHLLGKFDFGGIPPALRGQAQIEVTLETYSDTILNVSAVDKATGKGKRYPSPTRDGFVRSKSRDDQGG